MKIHLLSDLHLEHGSYQLNIGSADVLVLAGDIHVRNRAVEWILEQNLDIPVIYVLGNHEFYGRNYLKMIRSARESAKGTNVHVLEKDSIEIDGVGFHGATLWTDMNLYRNVPLARLDAMAMNDYKLIRLEPRYSKLRPIDTERIHQESVIWLKKSLEESTSKKNVVVTHHAPSELSIPEHYKGDRCSPCYASSLENLMLDLAPDYWFHGHTHCSSDYVVGNTRVVANPRGYSDHENEFFDSGLILEI